MRKSLQPSSWSFIVPHVFNGLYLNRAWREKQAEEIKKRDEASAARRQETISKAERAIDQFYEEYNAKKERNIKENK